MQAKTDDVQAMVRKTGWRHDIAMNKGLYLLSRFPAIKKQKISA